MAVEYIKRKDVIEAICNLCRIENDDCSYPRCSIINNVRSINAANVVPRELYQRALSDVVTLTVERKCGEWIHRTGNRDECSNCGARYYQDLKEPFMNFCPNCGAQMESGDK